VALQTILGGGGVIANETAKHLRQYSPTLRVVSRKPNAHSVNDEIFPCDLTHEQEVMQAVRGSDVVYLTAGLEYNLKQWRVQWPRIMTNVIEACIAQNSKFVFFDNVYMYGKVKGPMRETTPYNPCSEKGEVRATIAVQLEEVMQRGEITALIARSADFYGPHSYNTFTHPMVFQALQTGKKPMWMGRSDLPHSFTFTPDAGKAVALLGNTPSAYNRVWHLPTAPEPITGDQFISGAANQLNRSPKFYRLSRSMVRIVGLFNSMAKETVEMMYQYEHPYLFDSSQFSQTFYPATAYADGIRQTVMSLSE
jgi:nucleoside-diphosphate-sugar epimerase